MPIATSEAPKRDSRSGSSVPVAPIVPASSRISQQPRAILGSLASTRSGAPAPSAARGGSGCSKRPRRQRERHAADAREHDPGTDRHRDRTEHGPISVPKIADANTDAEHRTAALRWRDRDHPSQAAAPDAAARDPLDEPQPVERHEVRAEPERDDRAGEQQQAERRWCAARRRGSRSTLRAANPGSSPPDRRRRARRSPAWRPRTRARSAASTGVRTEYRTDSKPSSTRISTIVRCSGSTARRASNGRRVRSALMPSPALPRAAAAAERGPSHRRSRVG